MRQEVASNLIEFIQLSDIFDFIATTVIFRGQAVQGNLLPGIARSIPTRDSADLERDSIRQLRLMGESRRFVSLDVNRSTKKLLTEIRIPAECRSDILRSLRRHGISSRTLFPDLAGLCQDLNLRLG